jgi:hypothetical protein
MMMKKKKKKKKIQKNLFFSLLCRPSSLMHEKPLAVSPHSTARSPSAHRLNRDPRLTQEKKKRKKKRQKKNNVFSFLCSALRVSHARTQRLLHRRATHTETAEKKKITQSSHTDAISESFNRR